MRFVRLHPTVLLLGLTSFWTDAGSEMIFPLLPLFLTGTLGASPGFLGIVEGAADLVASLLKLGAGKLSDRLGMRKPLVLAGYGIAGLVRPLVAFATAPWHVLAVRLTDRVGKGIRGAPRDALIADAATPETASTAFGFHRAMDHAGAVVGPLIAASLLSAGLPLRTVFLCAAVPGALALVTTAVVKERPVVVAESAPDVPVGPPGKLPRRFWRLLGIFALFGLGNSSDAFLLLRAHELGVDSAAIPLLWSAFHVSKVGWSAVGGWVGDRVRRVYAIGAGWAVYGVVYLLFAVAWEAWHAWALFLIYGAFFGLTEPVEKALVRDLVPPESRGSAFGWLSLVSGLVALPASVLIGAIWQASSAFYAFTTGATVAAVAIGSLVVWTVRDRSDAA